jgi:hypothetical protein
MSLDCVITPTSIEGLEKNLKNEMHSMHSYIYESTHST